MKVGDMVEIIAYEGVAIGGRIIEVENWGTEDSRLEIEDKEGYVAEPWLADDSCVRLLTPLEMELL